MAGLLSNFELVKEVFDGVNQLRQLVLGLAIRGRLVPQHPEDLPAPRLVEHSLQTKSNNPAASDGTSTNNGPFELPCSWEWVRLDHIADFEIGRTPPTKEERFWAKDGIPWVSIADMPSTGRVVTTRRSVTDSAAREVFKKPPAPAGTLLMSFKLSIGKVAFLETPSYYNEAIIAIYPPTPGISSYLQVCLQAIDLLGGSAAAVKGSTLNKSSLSALLIPLPPIEEQGRIVDKVDSLMAMCDNLEASLVTENESKTEASRACLYAITKATEQAKVKEAWKRVQDRFEVLFDAPDSVGDLRQSILQLAVQGRLVCQLKTDEPAAEALKRISRERVRLIEQGQACKAKDVTPIAPKECPFESIPESWEWVRATEIYDVSGGITKNAQRKPVENHYPYLRVANVQRGRLDLSAIERFELFNGELDRWRLHPNDLLVVEGNGSEHEIGRCAVWHGEIPDCVHQNHLIRLRPIAHDGHDFTLRFFNSPSGMDEMKKRAITTSGLYSLSVGKIRDLVIPMPPIEEQLRIVERLKTLLNACNTADVAIEQRSTHASSLLASLIHQVLSLDQPASTGGGQ